ncbi:hypothetical protein JST97_13550 [bacterium]|nr:hypothetical protein [bacterium]
MDWQTRLEQWAAMQEEMDQAPLEREHWVRSQFRASREQARLLELDLAAHPDHQSTYFRERARLEGFLGGDPLPWLRRSLESAARLEQWDEIERTRDFLKGYPDPAFNQSRLRPLFDALPMLTQAQSVEALRRATLVTVLKLAPLRGVLWLERSGIWQVEDWEPLGAYPRFSLTLAEECWKSQDLVWGGPDQVRASRSLLLSEIRCLLALPVGDSGVLFGWQAEGQTWLSLEQIHAVRFLAQIVSALVRNLEGTRQAYLELERAEQLRQRWQQIFQQAGPLALAEWDEDERVVAWNPLFGSLFPRVFKGLELKRLAAPEQWRSNMVRLEISGGPRWFQFTRWRVPEHPGSYSALVDVTENELQLWFDHIDEARQLLASDLHDGPAQIAATLSLVEPEARPILEEVRRELDFLSSPSYQSRSPWEWLEHLRMRYFPSFQLRFKDVPQGLPQVVLVRALADLIEWASSSPPLGSLRCKVRASRVLVDWEPARPLPLEICRLLKHRIRLIGGDCRRRPGRLKIRFPTED